MFARLALVSCAALVAVGCRSTYIHKSIYDRDLAAMKDYASGLERRNTDLEAKARALENLQDISLISRTQDELYEQIAESLKSALDGLRQDGETAMSYDARRGVWTAGTDLLFDSGRWTVSPTGLEILKKFAEAHRGKNLHFRIVGHTDRAPIVKEKTKRELETDTNMELSARRAIAVMGALKGFGMSESQFLECVGMGNTQPVAPNDRNASNMKKNRRVELFVLK
ncbi:MAG: OmpA family protein [Planctomycetes bacterium]|nr:OmpA family protein [Planctomycetota bacterium]